MRRAAGFTLLELMIVVVLTVTVSGAVLFVVKSLQDGERLSAAYTQDLNGLRRAVRAVENDLRHAKQVSDLDWHLEEGRLRRGKQVVAHNIATFDLKPEGDRVQVRIALGPRTSPAHRNAAAVDFTVRMRNGGAR